MKLIRSSNPQSQEEGFHFLTKIAHIHVKELIEEFHLEKDIGLKSWLLELVGEAKSEEALETLKANLTNENESLQEWSIWGLKNLNSKEARRILFEHGIVRD